MEQNLHVGNVLVLAEQGNVQQNGQRSSVGSEDDNLSNTTVEGLGGLVGTLLQLTVVGGLLDQIEDVLGQGGVGDGPGGGVVLRHFWERVGGGWRVRVVVIWLARRFLAVCSPGVHGRRVWVGEMGVRELCWKKEEFEVAKEFDEVAALPWKAWRAVGGRAGPRELGPPSHVYGHLTACSPTLIQAQPW
jgi:hypothetical protein